MVDARVDESILDSSLDTLRHRGPDGRGVNLDRRWGVGIAHARLAIMDPATGAQPLTSDDDELALVCNGEIYDFERQRRELEEEGFRFKTKSDSEVILHLYRRGPNDFLDRLRGEFAFVLVDKRRGRLFAARDRFGIKPLYVARTDRGGWVFASEVKAIYATGLVRRSLDPLAMVAGDPYATVFRGVRHAAPATVTGVDLRTGGHDVRTYWKPEFPRERDRAGAPDLRLAVEETDRLFTEALRLRLRSDVPVGMYLSGGIDSALVVAKSRRLLDRAPKAFTIAFVDEPAPFDESEYARATAAHVGVEHHVLPVRTEDLWENLEACLWHVEAPLSQPGAVGKYLLSSLAAAHVKVVLTGEGADEVFLGYSVFQNFARPAPRLLSAANEAARRAVTKQLFAAFGGRAREPLEGGPGWAGHDRSQLEGREPVVRLQYRRLHEHLMPTILCALGDRTEMAHSIEGRLPFLDHELFAFAKTIRVEHNLKDGVEKYVVRQIARELLPRAVVERKKWPFSASPPRFDGRSNSHLGRLAENHLSKAAFERAGLFGWRGWELLRSARRLPGFAGVADMMMFQVFCTQVLHGLFVEGRRDQDVAPPRPSAVTTAYAGVE